ncbi:MAG: amidohydrolase family protein [Armatimonadota bacterium]
MRSHARCFDDLKAFIDAVPLVDCHDHSAQCGPKLDDPIMALITGYVGSDLQSASSDADIAVIYDTSLPLEERWPLLERAWKRTCHTGYAQVTRRVLKRFYEEDALTLEALYRVKDRLLDLGDPAFFDSVLEEAKIAARIEDVWPDMRKVIDGTLPLSPRGRLAIGLPGLHMIRCYNDVQGIANCLKRSITSLDDYLEACGEIFTAHKRFGAVCFKDQSAYSRALDYGNPTRAEAEAVFNWFMADPRRSVSYPDGVKPLDDFLFHQFMRMARDLDLPVQIHTGHMAGIRNDIVKTNAAGLTSVLELHRDVRFDLFHANWPYSGELLYLGKNYPNVTLDFCWANIIDPVYCVQTLKQALSCVPHGKIHGYGSDYGGNGVLHAWAHAQIARENIAVALAEMVDADYLNLDDAKEVAQAWLFDNANEFFRLQLDKAAVV